MMERFLDFNTVGMWQVEKKFIRSEELDEDLKKHVLKLLRGN